MPSDRSPGPHMTGDAGAGARAVPAVASGQASAGSAGDTRLLPDSSLSTAFPRTVSALCLGAAAVAMEAAPLFMGMRSRFSDPRGRSPMMDLLSLSLTLTGDSPPGGGSQAT